MAPNDVDKDLLTVKQASDEADVSSSTIYNWIAEGKFKTRVIGGITLIDRKSWKKRKEAGK